MKDKLKLSLLIVFLVMLTSSGILLYFYLSLRSEAPNKIPMLEKYSFKTLDLQETQLGYSVETDSLNITYMLLTGLLKNGYQENGRNYFVIVIPYGEKTLDIAVDLGDDEHKISEHTQKSVKKGDKDFIGTTVRHEYKNVLTKEIFKKYSKLKGTVLQFEIYLDQGGVDKSECDSSSWCSYNREEIEKYKEPTNNLINNKVNFGLTLDVYLSGKPDLVIGPVVTLGKSYEE